MAKAKDTTLPKFLRLAKGSMWFDTDGPESSGITLIVGDDILTSRRTKDVDWENSHAPLPTVPKDMFNNDSTEDGKYGFITIDEDRSIFDTTTIPVEKQKNILNAYQQGILVEYDPKVGYKSEVKKEQAPNFAVRDGDIVFVGKNEEMFNRLNTYTDKAISEFISKCGPSARANLLDLLDYEERGYNPLNRPRGEIMDAIRAKLNSFGPGITPLTKNSEFDE